MFDVRTRDHSLWATKTMDSWDLGWRSLLVSRYTQHPDVEDVTVPAAGQQMICLLLSGRKTAAVADGANWRTARLDPGDISMTSPHRATRIRWRATTREPLDHLSVHLPTGTTARVAEEIWERDPARVPFPDALGKPDPLLRHTLVALLRAAAQGTPDLYAASAAEFLVVHLLTQHGRLPAVRGYPREDNRVRRARQFMRAHLHLPLTLATIAGEVGLSRYHFLRIFREQTGETPHRYLTRIRLDKAVQELERGSAPIAEIARRCGFPNPAHFSRAFTRERGYPPSAQRL